METYGSAGIPNELTQLRHLNVVFSNVLFVFICVPLQLQVHPSPEPAAGLHLLPRLCHLVKGDHGYGFNLHSNRTKDGQFVRSVDPGSAAEGGGIRPGDRLVEVNTKHTHTHTHMKINGPEYSCRLH